MTFQGTFDSETAFNVASVTDDGTNTIVGTSLVGSSFPSVPRQGGTRLDMMVHPCPKLTLINCTGSNDALDLSQSGAQGQPYASYSKRSYAAATLINPIAGPELWGRISSVTVRVDTPFTTAGALTLNLFGQFLTGALDPNNTQTAWLPVVNLKIGGTRTVTATTVTGAQAGDTLSAPGLIWFDGRQGPFISGAITGGDPGTVSIEVQTDQRLQKYAIPVSRLHA
jgi:hypothetical protein